MTIKALSAAKKNSPLLTNKNETVFFRGIEGSGRAARVTVADSVGSKKTRTVTPQSITGPA